MSRRPALFRQSDLCRAIKAAKQAGATMAVEICPDGTIRLVPADASPLSAPANRPAIRPWAS